MKIDKNSNPWSDSICITNLLKLSEEQNHPFVTKQIAVHFFHISLRALSAISWDSMDDPDLMNTSISQVRGESILIRVLNHRLWTWSASNVNFFQNALKKFPHDTNLDAVCKFLRPSLTPSDFVRFKVIVAMERQQNHNGVRPGMILTTSV